MLPRFLSFVSSKNRNHKSNRRHHSRGRSLRGFENLEGREMMTAVPAYSSLAGAPVTVYLDFNGHHENVWGNTDFPNHPDAKLWNDVNTPVFSLDGDQNFNATELDYIHRIWKCVAEDFSIFNINVTTVEPPASQLGHTIRVCIGGNSMDWVGELYGGISIQGSFPDDALANVVYVFTENLNTARSMADAASQEVGHSLGLDHQRIWDNYTGEIIEEYNPGTYQSAPIMGVSYNSLRSLWWYDPKAENGWYKQDDINEILDINIGVVELRTDDHGGSYQTATNVTNVHAIINGVIASNGQGVSGMPNDRDAFNVTLPTASSVMKNWVVTVEVDGYSANLDAKLQIYKYDTAGKGSYAKPPQLIGTVDDPNDLGAFFNLGKGGSYMIVVSSHGNFGDLGQYTVRFREVTTPIVNTNPISLPPIIDVICDPQNPVVLPGQSLGQTLARISQLNLAGLSAGPPLGGTMPVEPMKLSGASSQKSPTGFAALDEAFAQFGAALGSF
jgi:hypothetical protein